MSELHTDIRYVKGVGEARAKSLAKLGITDLRSLLSYFPRAYEDRRAYKRIDELTAGESACVMDQIGDTKNTDEQWLEQIALEEAIKRLSQREKHILALRFYDGRTQMEVAKEVGISQAQVSRLEKNAINQIKKNITA